MNQMDATNKRSGSQVFWFSGVAAIALVACLAVLAPVPVHAQAEAGEIDLNASLPDRLPRGVRTRGDLVELAARSMGVAYTKSEDQLLVRLLDERLPSGSSGLGGRRSLEALHLVLGDGILVYFENEGSELVLRRLQESGSVPSAYVTPKKTNAPMSPSVVGGFAVEPGSLRTRARQLVAAYGWRLVGWDENLRLDGRILDWRIHAPFVISAPRLSDALKLLIEPYGLQAVMYTQDRTVAIRIVASSRTTATQ